MEGEERRREERRRREPEVSLEAPRFDAFSILMASADGCVRLRFSQPIRVCGKSCLFGEDVCYWLLAPWMCRCFATLSAEIEVERLLSAAT